jgi:dTDP-4-amino-4,6-dideoxygalactose transaminase
MTATASVPSGGTTDGVRGRESAFEQRVASLFGMRAGFAAARGSSALYALFKRLATLHGPGEIVFPALCCESIVLAAIYAGHRPKFADVSAGTLCVTPETLAPVMSDRTRAVIIVHLYGVDAEASKFSALRQKYQRAVFVEDIAHALGGRDTAGQLLGGKLDFTLLSFADDKIVQGDGGVLLIGGGDISRDEIAVELPATAPEYPAPHLARSLRDLVHGLVDLKRSQAEIDISGAFGSVLHGYRDLIVCSGGIRDEAVVGRGLDTLESNQTARYRNYLRYKNGISNEHARVIPLREGSTCWRCPVLLDSADTTRRLTQELRHRGYNASNHYPSLSFLFGGNIMNNAEALSSRILNLWTGPAMTQSDIDGTVAVINGLKG